MYYSRKFNFSSRVMFVVNRRVLSPGGLSLCGRRRMASEKHRLSYTAALVDGQLSDKFILNLKNLYNGIS